MRLCTGRAGKSSAGKEASQAQAKKEATAEAAASGKSVALGLGPFALELVDPGVGEVGDLGQDQDVVAAEAGSAPVPRGRGDEPADGPLLERHLWPSVGSPRGDLPIAFLGRKYADTLGTQTQLARMTEYTGEKQHRAHPDITATDYRTLLPRMLTGDHAVIRQARHRGTKTKDLEFYGYRGEKLYKAVFRAVAKRSLRLVTFHRATEGNLKNAKRRGEVIEDFEQK